MDISKDLVAASATPLILTILLRGDSYGYAIIQRVRELSGGKLEWTDGMLYPILKRLEEQRYIESTWRETEGRRRKYYSLLEEGRRALANQRAQWKAVTEALAAAWGTRGGTSFTRTTNASPKMLMSKEPAHV